MFLFQDAWWSAKSDLPSFHDNVILTLQNESNRIRKHVFFCVSPQKQTFIYWKMQLCSLVAHGWSKWLLWPCALRLVFFSEDFFQNDENKSSFTEIDRRCCQWTILLLTVHSFLTRNKYYHITSIQSHEYPSWTGNKEHLAQNFWIFLTSTDKSYPKHFRFMQDE